MHGFEADAQERASQVCVCVHLKQVLLCLPHRYGGAVGSEHKVLSAPGSRSGQVSLYPPIPQLPGAR